MRIFGLFFLLASILFGAPKSSKIKSLWNKKTTSSTTSSTDDRIRDTKSRLEQTDGKQKQLNQQLAKIAKSIRRAEKENIALKKALKKLGKVKEKNEEKFVAAKKKIKAFKDKIETLDGDIERQNTHFVNLLTNQFSLMIAINEIDKLTVDSIVMREIYETYKKQNTRGLKSLKEKISVNKKKKKIVLGYQKKIEKSIYKIGKKRELYLKKKAQKEKLLKKLVSDEEAYRKSIKELVGKQNLIRSTLAKLDIIHKEEIAEAREREKERIAEIDRRAAARSVARSNGEQVSAKSFASNENIKRYGSSYHKDKIYRYRGAKTMSPLKGSRVVKSFGTYVDPIYKMKIFNESVTLKSAKANSKVRNVLNGKVVFAGQNSMLGKVIVVSHGNKLHTVYAGLDKISPLIKNGSRVKKGAVLGKVKRKLIFEATKNSKYINPLRLIRL